MRFLYWVWASLSLLLTTSLGSWRSSQHLCPSPPVPPGLPYRIHGPHVLHSYAILYAQVYPARQPPCPRLGSPALPPCTREPAAVRGGGQIRARLSRPGPVQTPREHSAEGSAVIASVGTSFKLTTTGPDQTQVLAPANHPARTRLMAPGLPSQNAPAAQRHTREVGAAVCAPSVPQSAERVWLLEPTGWT